MTKSRGGERTPRPVHYEKSRISDEKLDELIALYSPPGRKKAVDMYGKIWSLVCDLKGWL